MKKLTILLILLTLNSCVSQSKTDTVLIEKYYFYFDKTHPKMKTYGKPRELRHLYDLDNYDPIIFIPKDSIVKKIRIDDLKNYNVKDYNWLNKLTGKEIDYFFHVDKTVKEYYLIEKKGLDKYLSVRKVYFIEEID